MKIIFTWFISILVAAIVLWPRAVDAGNASKVTGGGTGTFGADLDGDGDIDGSQFGMGVVIHPDGSAQGHFECLMAGRSDILGLPLMAVEAKVTDGSITLDGQATFGGVARVNLANGQIFREMPIQVTVTEGVVGEGALQLTVIGAFDGVPGDTITGNGNYDLPNEIVSSGQIKIH